MEEWEGGGVGKKGRSREDWGDRGGVGGGGGMGRWRSGEVEYELGKVGVRR